MRSPQGRSLASVAAKRKLQGSCAPKTSRNGATAIDRDKKAKENQKNTKTKTTGSVQMATIGSAKGHGAKYQSAACAQAEPLPARRKLASKAKNQQKLATKDKIN